MTAQARQQKQSLKDLKASQKVTAQLIDQLLKNLVLKFLEEGPKTLIALQSAIESSIGLSPISRSSLQLNSYLRALLQRLAEKNEVWAEPLWNVPLDLAKCPAAEPVWDVIDLSPAEVSSKKAQ